MVEDSAEHPKASPRKVIPADRDRWQADWLVGVMTFALVAMFGLRILVVVGMEGPPRWFLWSSALSAAFAWLVWRLRAGTIPAAAIGGLICLKMLLLLAGGGALSRTALPELIALFAMTFLATRFARRRRAATGATEGASGSEERHGRRAAQVVANLGIAGLLANSPIQVYFVAALAALAEATADTVASELGQALAGRTVMLTSLRRVAPGTDGGVSLAGTALGAAAAGAVALLAVLTGAVGGIAGTLVFVAGCAGLLFDSLLGATLEQRGWIGNDLVNFASTGFAAWLAFHAAVYLVPPQPYW